MRFHVPELHCDHCSAAVEKAINAIDAGARADADLAPRTVTVASTNDTSSLQATLKDVGYCATPV